MDRQTDGYCSPQQPAQLDDRIQIKTSPTINQKPINNPDQFLIENLRACTLKATSNNKQQVSQTSNRQPVAHRIINCGSILTPPNKF
jgi:hypothetical protein